VEKEFPDYPRSLRDLSGHPERRMENSLSLDRLVIPRRPIRSAAN
jgi:hypothetical protein